mmetsp:Transcript_30443/g.70779  ORF Transcript_30443/g.70779 Transcript_30443/m.70779 type:complete len:210 (-) Transcript_30443:881-1510(-)
MRLASLWSTTRSECGNALERDTAAALVGTSNCAHATSCSSRRRWKAMVRTRSPCGTPSATTSAGSAGECLIWTRALAPALHLGNSTSPERSGFPSSSSAHKHLHSSAESSTKSWRLSMSSAAVARPTPPSSSSRTPMGCCKNLASKACGFGRRSGCISPLMQKAPSEGVPASPKSPPYPNHRATAPSTPPLPPPRGVAAFGCGSGIESP